MSSVKPDSSLRLASPCAAAASRRFEETGKVGIRRPSRSRWPASRSRTRRQSGNRSVFDKTQTTVGQAARACRRNVISGAVNSLDASDTRMTASAVGSAARVLAAWLDARPPTPGVSTKTRPSLRICRGSSALAPTTARVSRRSVATDDRGREGVDGDRQLLRLGEPAVGGHRRGGDQEGRRRGGPVAHLHRHRGREVVVDRAYRRVDQRVDELALALLELPDDEDADRRVRQAASRMPQARHEVGSALLLAQRASATDEIWCGHAHGHHSWCGGTPTATSVDGREFVAAPLTGS